MCVNLIVIKIDCDTDQTIKIDNEALNEIITNVTNSVSIDSSTRISNINSLRVNIGGNVDCTDVNFNQQNNSQVSIVNSFTDEQKATINNDIINKIRNTLEQEQIQGLTAVLNNLTQAGAVNNKQDLINKITNSVKNTLDNIDINNFWTGINQGNVLTVNIAGNLSGENCNFVQTNFLNARVVNTAEAIQSNLAQDKFMNEVLTAAKQTTDTGDVSRLLKWIVIGAVAIVGLLIIFAVIYLIYSYSESKNNG